MLENQETDFFFDAFTCPYQGLAQERHHRDQPALLASVALAIAASAVAA